jgi:hypothetical protein
MKADVPGNYEGKESFSPLGETGKGVVNKGDNYQLYFKYEP